MTYTIWIKELNGEGAAWSFLTIGECFKFFNRLIGLYTDAYYKHSAYVLDENSNNIINTKQFKREFKKWFETENKDKTFLIYYNINGRREGLQITKETKEDAEEQFKQWFVSECVIESIEEIK